MEGNYMQLHDNVMDLTHFGFVHRDTLGVTDWTKPPKVTTTKTTVTFRQEFSNRALQPFHASVTGTAPDRLASRFVTEGAWISPALHVAREIIEFHDAVPGEREKFTMEVAHATTPSSMDRYRYYFLVGWDVDLPRDIKEAMEPGVRRIFGQDKTILEAISAVMARDTRGVDYPEIKLQADTPQLHARQKLKELLSRE
jgi:vanillate O-demethylase monooxygenase subunit